MTGLILFIDSVDFYKVKRYFNYINLKDIFNMK